MKARNRRAFTCMAISAAFVTATAVPAHAAQINSEIGSAVQENPADSAATAAAQAVVEAERQNFYGSMGVAQVSDYVNVRSDASVDSEIVGTLSNNGVATVEGEVDGWYQVTSGPVSGYIKSDYLTVGDRELVDSVSTRKAEVDTETLRVRSEASTDASITELVEDGDDLTVLNEGTDGWVNVETENGSGYVSADYVHLYDEYEYAKEPAVSDGGSAVIDYALQFVGNPYVWGGTSLTNGADCSGFILSVYEHFGISLPHSSAAMRSSGIGVSYDEAQPGDIICYDGHVALYMGDGRIVHASNRRDGIKISENAAYRNILAVRRVLG